MARDVLAHNGQRFMDPGFAPVGREHRFVVAERNQRDREVGFEAMDGLRVGVGPDLFQCLREGPGVARASQLGRGDQILDL